MTWLDYVNKFTYFCCKATVFVYYDDCYYITDVEAAYHVWLLGSQVSFPTLSMQNFWGPLLPERIKMMKTISYENGLQLF